MSRDSLEAYAQMGGLLRSMTPKDATKRKTIDRLCELAEAVGTSEQSTELVIGLLLRHIKSNGSTPQQVVAVSQSSDPEAANDVGKKQLGCWYVLDKLCRSDARDRYAHTASTYMTEVADYIPWENVKLAASYRALMEGWLGTFPEHVVQSLWESQELRRMRLQNPSDYRQQLLDEEQEWAREESNQLDDGKLNEYGQPCMDYLQGKCSWGDQCKQLHPPGLEGSLPPECRLGDWKCVCGTINRHFRRRCSSCPKEKPQYRRDQQVSIEEKLLTHPEDFSTTFRQQFGYDPNSNEEAIRYWRKRFALMDREAALHGSDPHAISSSSGIAETAADVVPVGSDRVSDAAFATSARAIHSWRVERSLAYRSRILRFNRALGMMLPSVTPSPTNLLAETSATARRNADAPSSTTANDHEALLAASKVINWAQPHKEDYDPSVVLEQPVTKRHRGEEVSEGSASFYKYTPQGLRELVGAALKLAKVDGGASVASMPALERVSTLATLVIDRGIAQGTPELLVALSKTLDEIAVLAASELKVDCVGVAQRDESEGGNKTNSFSGRGNVSPFRGIPAVVRAIFSIAPSKAAGLLASGGGRTAPEKLFTVAKLVFGGMQTGKLPGRGGVSFFNSLAPFVGIDADLYVRVSVAAKTGEVLGQGESVEAALNLIDDLQSVPLIPVGEDRVNQLRAIIRNACVV